MLPIMPVSGRTNDAHRDAQNDPHGGESPALAGVPLASASYALLLVHGRGGTAEGMLPIARAAGAADGAVIALRAAGGSWYPDRFLAPTSRNQPWLDSALAAVGRAVDAVVAAGIPSSRILLVGFSQGACLSLEYAARNPRRLGAVAALAGALIGEESEQRYEGDLQGTPILLACGDADEHIPVARVQAAAAILGALGAATDVRIYPGVNHTIVGDQLDALRDMLDAVRATIPAG